MPLTRGSWTDPGPCRNRWVASAKGRETKKGQVPSSFHVGFFTSGGNTIVRLSTDTEAASEAEIQLNGILALTAQDFHLWRPRIRVPLSP